MGIPSRRAMQRPAGLLRRTALAACLALGVASAARAGETMAYTPEAFAAAQSGGKPVLVEVSAPWCPICKAQKPILAKLAKDPRFKDLTILDVDFDSRKDVLKQLGVRMQSTLIVYKGDKEVGRSIGETQPEWIEGLVEKAL